MRRGKGAACQSPLLSAVCFYKRCDGFDCDVNAVDRRLEVDAVYAQARKTVTEGYRGQEVFLFKVASQHFYCFVTVSLQMKNAAVESKRQL